MNYYRFRHFIPKERFAGSFHFIRWLRTRPPFRWAHFDILIQSPKNQKTILCFAQIHTVNRGKVTAYMAKRIARVQARLFTFFKFLLDQKIVQSFGVEGITDSYGQNDLRFDNRSLAAGLKTRDIKTLQTRENPYKLVKKIFIKLSKQWQKHLTKYPNDPSKVAQYSSKINAMRMLNFLDPNFRIYPIEGEKEFRFITQNMEQHHNRIHELEQDTNFISAAEKSFRGLTGPEMIAVNLLNSEIKKLNNLLEAPIREEAQLQLALRKLEQSEVTAFVMGVGHRDNLLQAAKKILRHKDTSFVLITPQELWLWKSAVWWMKRILLVISLIGLYILWLKFF